MSVGAVRGALWVGFALLMACGGRGGSTTTPAAGERVSLPAAPLDTYSSEATEGGVRGGAGAEGVGRGVERAAASAGQSVDPDGRLAQLAEWIGERLGAGGAPPAPEVIELFARSLGLVEPVPHLAVLGVPDPNALEAGVADSVRGFFARQLYQRYGAAVVVRGGLNVAVVLLSTRALDLEPVPRRHEVGGTLRLRGRVHDGFREPQLAIAPPSGSVERRPLGAGPGFEVSVPLTARGVYRVEVLAQGARGDTVLANFPVYVGEDPPTYVVLAGPGDDEGASTPDQVERALLRRINDARARDGLPPVVEHPGLARVARDHSQDMVQGSFIGHTSPTTGDAPDRVRRAGYRSGLILENIGRGYSPGEIHEGLLASPGHRANILNRDVTHVGVGVVAEPEGRRAAFVATQVFIRMHREVDVEAAREWLLGAINEGRRARGVPPLELDPNLQTAASDAARSYFANPTQTQQDTVDEGSAALRRFAMMFRRVGGLMAVVGDVAEASRLEPTFDPDLRYVGLGVAQGDRPDAPPNSIAVVIMLAWPR
ncbi:MAG: hypothetical protein KF901_13215 [Myxococcales bacterium]|nr:hypothetical protein [Myxococcales bacterium]